MVPPTSSSSSDIWRRAFRGAMNFWKEVSAHGVFDRAAGLTYYSVLSIFPALVVGVALLGLIGITGTLLDQLAEFAPGPARDLFESIITEIASSERTSGSVALVAGSLGALWTASAYVGAFGRAALTIMPGDRRVAGWKMMAARVVVTGIMLLSMAAVAVMVVVSGPLAEKLARFVGLDSGAPRVWSLAKWPFVLVVMVLVVTLLYSTVRVARTRAFVGFIPVGGLVAIALWIPISVGFSYYVSQFSNYSAVYGSLAGVVVFLVWLWLSNVALLIGVIVEARRLRRRATVTR